MTDAIDGPFRELIRYVLMDRDTKFTAEFRAILKSSGVASVLLPPKSPNCNAHLERFFRSLKEEALERMIFFSERALRTATNEFVAHFHAERNHQGLDHRIIERATKWGRGPAAYSAASGWVACSIITIVKPPDTAWGAKLTSRICRPAARPPCPALRQLADMTRIGRDFEVQPLPTSISQFLDLGSVF